MLTIQITEGKHSVVVTCERCKHRIEGSDDGIAIYEKPGGPIQFLHRDCEDEHAHQHHLSMSMDIALVEAFKSIAPEEAPAA